MRYLKTNNIIKEGFFSNIMKILKMYPDLKSDRRIKNKIKDLNSKVEDLEATLNRELRQYGSEKKIKIKPYSVRDFE